ncbi:39S ribosomal protein L17, mitochondrial [Microplitis mediator]|uniref:39S ribosomal protein L17, mitochondrial n=1 Tax=Microplitis mediator TaxID=375433 RepID=UPI0025553D99|nr:39S ribosomal protein L17, mitochondrial [Microplitis mediator]XP_057329567.1 39S ribosomal protein L17, mitochondrial [Microplitis mediator]
MNQAKVTNLVSQLNFKVQNKARRLKSFDGPEGRVRKIQKTLTALFKYERIELFYNRADEVRGYADRLISEAIRHGPSHEETMALADFWILEKQYVHKLFKVLVPRYQDYSNTSFTKMHRLEKRYPDACYWNSVLELKGNPFPSIDQVNPYKSQLIHNVLLDEARKEFRLQKYKDLADNLTQ